MSTHLEWPEIALRLALALAAGALTGLERSSSGHPAGLRTSVLVCLAAAVAMLQVNILLGAGGRRPDSFIMLDLMRLPLGILSGIGFIGGGAILRKGSMVQGITTAATLWFLTVIGLCLGGGQIGLGLTSLVLALVTLRGFKWIEQRIRGQKQADLIVTTGPGGPSEQEIREQMTEAGLVIAGCAVTYTDQARRRRLLYTVHWRARSNETLRPAIVGRFAQQPGVEALEWCPSNEAGESKTSS
jgi:putative Mg2+ transporter-C (MgtC) family protein